MKRGGIIISKDQSNKLLLKKEEMILLKNSEVCKDSEIYGNLFSVLSEYNTFSEEEFYKNRILDDKARTVLISNKKMLIDSIKSEWVGIGCNDIATGKMNCQLCGRKNIYIHYIQNRSNDIELNVGSECINKFPNIENISSNKKNHSEQRKQRDSQVRRIEFDALDLESVDYIAKSEEWFTEIDILLPFNLYNELKDVIRGMFSLRTTYITKGGNFKEVSSNYSNLKTLFEELKLKAIEFYDKNKRKKLICKREMSEWLRKEHCDVWELVSKNNGIFTEKTLEYAYKKEYIEKHLSDFSKSLEDTDLKIVGMNGNSIRFVIKNSNYIYPVSFIISGKIFMQKVGCHALAIRNYKFNKNDLESVVIEQSANNFEALYNRLVDSIKKIGLDIYIEENSQQMYYVKLPQVIKSSKWSDKVIMSEIAYKKLDSVFFFKTCSNFLFYSDNEIQKRFESLLNNLTLKQSGWLSKADIDKSAALSNEVKMQKQREYTHYV